MSCACSRCGKDRDRQGQRYCLACHAAYMRAHRPRHSELTPEARHKANARSYANVYQRRGKLIPESCEVCGSDLVQKHHEDYDKPLQVNWMCVADHHDLHLGQTPTPRGT